MMIDVVGYGARYESAPQCNAETCRHDKYVACMTFPVVNSDERQELSRIHVFI